MDRVGQFANFVVFEAGWFLCVLGGANRWEWAGPAALALVVGTHLAVVEGRRGRELVLIAGCGLAGTLFDSLLAAAGCLGFPHGSWWAPVCPFWFTVLWMNFGTLPGGCLSWLRGRHLLAAGFGLIGGPISYYAGARMGAMTLQNNLGAALGAIAIEWALAAPAILWFARVLAGADSKPAPGSCQQVAPS